MCIRDRDCRERREYITREAICFQEAPMAVPAFPSGEAEGKEAPEGVVCVDDPAVVLSALRRGKKENEFLLRLFESTGQERKACVSVPVLQMCIRDRLMWSRRIFLKSI